MNTMNRSLGNYDMVLALSSSKINYQFKKMYQRKVIHSDWAFLTSSMGKEIATLTNEEANSYWKNLDIDKSSLEDKKAELKDLVQQMETAMDDDELTKAKELKIKKNIVKADVEGLQKKIDNVNQYDLGIIAKIAEPKIEILSKNNKELIFQITFKPGSILFYTHEGKKSEYDLGGNDIKYAFRVSIGKVKITSDRKIIEINNEDGKVTEKTLRDKGINDNDFTIQSLFLDFENANIANYDSESSTLPEAARENALLQAAMVNYFKNLSNSDNPYVLGYEIHKNEVNERERSLFYPTGVAYSTSYSKEKRNSTFNFLMLLNNNPFPSGGDAGTLPVSLMEGAQDKTATVNGVFGLNLREFSDNYIPQLSKQLCENIELNMKEKCKSTSLYNKNMTVRFGWHNVAGDIDIEYRGIKNKRENNGVDIEYAVTAKAEVHKEIEAALGTVGADWKLSTTGVARNSEGVNGTLIVTLKAGATGKLELKVNYRDRFKLGFETQEPTYKDKNDRDWANANKYIGDVIATLTSIETDIGKGFDDLDSINNIGAALNIEELGNFERRVILPVASVYTYKNVRVHDIGSNEVLLFDTSYGAISNNLKNKNRLCEATT